MSKNKILIKSTVGRLGAINGNGFWFDPAFGKNYLASFTKPFPKPMLLYHNTSSDPIGRAVKAELVSNKDNSYDVDVTFNITDDDAAEKFSNQTYLTVSMTISANRDDIECSICGNSINSEDCIHFPGREYEKDDKKEVCYWKFHKYTNKETSVVNNPADMNAIVKEIVANNNQNYDNLEYQLDFNNNIFCNYSNDEIIVTNFIDINSNDIEFINDVNKTKNNMEDIMPGESQILELMNELQKNISTLTETNALKSKNEELKLEVEAKNAEIENLKKALIAKENEIGSFASQMTEYKQWYVDQIVTVRNELSLQSDETYIDSIKNSQVDILKNTLHILNEMQTVKNLTKDIEKVEQTREEQNTDNSPSSDKPNSNRSTIKNFLEKN